MKRFSRAILIGMSATLFASSAMSMNESDLHTLVVGCGAALNLRDANAMVEGGLEHCNPNENCEFALRFGSDAIASVALEFDLNSGQAEQGSSCQASVVGVPDLDDNTAIAYFLHRHSDAKDVVRESGYFKALNCYEWGGQSEVSWQSSSDNSFHYYVYKFERQTADCGVQ